MPYLQCCCGRVYCAYLEQNNAALSGLEKDVETAAKLGQVRSTCQTLPDLAYARNFPTAPAACYAQSSCCSGSRTVRIAPANGTMIALSTKSKHGGLTFALQALLERHESYMSESEEERRRMAAGIEQLTNDKRSLEAENARAVHENKELLDQLEGMNTQIADSDVHIESLMATLSSAQFENKRLMALASRTAELEAQLTAMETRQSCLQEELITTQEDRMSAMRRWKHAETRLRCLNDQMQRIEREARDERDKHVEIVGRMEQRRTVEKELESAAGRLNGAAAASTLGRDKNGTNVVSHFVRDILHDNANLQASIVELRELLQTSNEEVQNLGEQVLRHQPISSDRPLQQASLMDEITSSMPKPVSQEVHVHHHYHANITTKKDRGPSFRRPSKRRGFVSSTSNSSAGCQTPVPRLSSNIMARPYPHNKLNRWSTQSSATGFSNVSALPSSPYSDHRSSSIFDCLESGFESSRPTSPESAGFASSHFQIEHQRPQSESHVIDLTDVSEDEPSSRVSRSYEKRRRPEAGQPVQTVHEDADVEHGISPLLVEQVAAASKNSQSGPKPLIQVQDLDPSRDIQHADAFNDLHLNRRGLRRSTSQESLVSISGMDIHLPQHRNTRLCLLPRPSSTSEASNSLIFSIAFPPPQPLASIVEVNASSSNLASPSISDSLSPVSLLSGLAGGKSPQSEAKGFGRLVGGWVRGRWGIAPMASTGHLREQAAFSESSIRVPGINQKGPIVRWRPRARTPSEVHAKVVDEGLLRESLVE